jgi:hypothetical protein
MASRIVVLKGKSRLDEPVQADIAPHLKVQFI